MTESTKFRLVSIDAWRNECGGWDWNNSYKVADDIELPDEITARKLLRFVRDSGWLNDHSKGRVSIDWHNEMFEPLIEICDKNTGEPLLALTTIHGLPFSALST